MEPAQHYIKATTPPALLARRIKNGKMAMIDGELHKHCPMCTEYWPADTEFFNIDTTSLDGLAGCCRDCSQTKQRKHRIRQAQLQE